jgi:outer membrane lipoprotein-sorting protein
MNLLLAAVLLMQDKSAAETLLKITESVTKAASLKVSFLSETVETDNATGKVSKIKNKCTLAISRAEKLYYCCQLLPQDVGRDLYICLDEWDLTTQVLNEKEIWKLDARLLRERMLSAFSRGGSVGMLGWLNEPMMDPAKGRIGVGRTMPLKGDPKAAVAEVQVSEVRRGRTEGELTYTLSFTLSTAKYQIALSYNPKTLKPLKQVATSRTETSTTTRTEIYDAFEINEGVSDDQFGEAIGEEPAARVLRKIHDVIFNSKTLRVKFTTEPPPPVPNNVSLGSMKGEILLKEGNKTKIIFEDPAPKGQAVKSHVVVSDGRTVSGEFVHFESVKDPAKVLQEMLHASLLGPGVLLGTYALGYGLAVTDKKNQEPDLRAAFRPMSIEAGDDNQGAKTLVYTLRDGLDAKVKVWYDPKDFRLLKRTITSSRQEQGAYVETYSEFVIDADIPDEKFKLPEEKK